MEPSQHGFRQLPPAGSVDAVRPYNSCWIRIF